MLENTIKYEIKCWKIKMEKIKWNNKKNEDT